MIGKPLMASGLMLAAPVAALAQDVDPLLYEGPAWSPYLVGALIGVLTLLTLYFFKKPVGASSAYADLAGLVGRAVAPQHIESLDYYREHKPVVSWTLIFVLAAIVGAWIAAWTGGEITARWVPPLWTDRFGDSAWSVTFRLLAAFAGGAIMAYGARLAGGCTSGHGISGALQLSLASWIAVIGFFIGGIVTAMTLYSI